MNWYAAIFGFLYTLGACALLVGFVFLVHWAGTELGVLGGVTTVVLGMAVGIGVTMGVTER